METATRKPDLSAAAWLEAAEARVERQNKELARRAVGPTVGIAERYQNGAHDNALNAA